MGVSENVVSTPLYPLVLLIMKSRFEKWLAIIGNIPNIFRQTQMPIVGIATCLMPKNRGLKWLNLLKHQIIDFEPSFDEKFNVILLANLGIAGYHRLGFFSIMAVTNNDQHSFWDFNLFQEPISILYLVIPYGEYAMAIWECQRKNRNFKTFYVSIEIGCGLSL